MEVLPEWQLYAGSVCALIRLSGIPRCGASMGADVRGIHLMSGRQSHVSSYIIAVGVHTRKGARRPQSLASSMCAPCGEEGCGSLGAPECTRAHSGEAMAENRIMLRRGHEWVFGVWCTNLGNATRQGYTEGHPTHRDTALHRGESL